MSVRLVLSGQSSQLRDAGGVGRYAHELYRRVRSPRIREYLPDADVIGLDLPDEQSRTSASGFGSGIRQNLKNVLRPLIPPALFDFLQARRVQSSTPSRSISLNSKSSAPVVFHEVTNYGSCDEIARLVL